MIVIIVMNDKFFNILFLIKCQFLYINHKVKLLHNVKHMVKIHAREKELHNYKESIQYHYAFLNLIITYNVFYFCFIIKVISFNSLTN